MNPFDWSGPSFLAFYVLLAGALALAVHGWWRWFPGSRRDAPPLPSDPYLLAYLVGGPREVLRAALLKLSLEKAISFDRKRLIRTLGPPKRQLVPFEAALWKVLAERPRTFEDLLELGLGDELAEPLRDRLESDGLVQARESMAVGQAVVVLAAGLLLVVALVKIGIGISRGRPVAILVVLAILTLLGGAVVRLSHLTGAGRRALGSVRALLEGARVRAYRQRGAAKPDELVMLAAVFGVGTVMMGNRPLLAALGADLAGQSGAAGGGSSSSCGGSCGGGCGGGGGGGGCGGCGGGGD